MKYGLVDCIKLLENTETWLTRGLCFNTFLEYIFLVIDGNFCDIFNVSISYWYLIVISFFYFFILINVSNCEFHWRGRIFPFFLPRPNFLPGSIVDLLKAFSMGVKVESPCVKGSCSFFDICKLAFLSFLSSSFERTAAGEYRREKVISTTVNVLVELKRFVKPIFLTFKFDLNYLTGWLDSKLDLTYCLMECDLDFGVDVKLFSKLKFSVWIYNFVFTFVYNCL